MSYSSGTTYLHGFSDVEQQRLRKQARFAEQTVYKNVDFSDCENILEVGCGVGAQSEILLRRFPKLNLTCIDLNELQLQACEHNLNMLPFAHGRFEIKKMDAAQMDFASRQFEGAFLCWILEHVPSPARVLAEVRRVLRPGAAIYVTEVANSSFFLDPYSPNIWRYWMAYNDYQYEQAGDPFVGAKLGNLLLSQGFREVQTEVKTWLYDNREPHKRKTAIDYWKELLLSAADRLLDAQIVDKDLVKKMQDEFDAVSVDPNAVFYYSFVQASARC